MYIDNTNLQGSRERLKLTSGQSTAIQIFRGLAVVAVVCIHNAPLGMAQVWFRPFVNFSVGLFLFFSGMLSDANNWCPKKRILKVLIPYAIWTFVYVYIDRNSISAVPYEYVKSLRLANSAAVMYYIFVYCQFTILIPLIDKLAKSRLKYLGFFISPIEILLMRYIPLATGRGMNEQVSDIMRVSCLGWFTCFDDVICRSRA